MVRVYLENKEFYYFNEIIDMFKKSQKLSLKTYFYIIKLKVKVQNENEKNIPDEIKFGN